MTRNQFRNAMNQISNQIKAYEKPVQSEIHTRNVDCAEITKD